MLLVNIFPMSSDSKQKVVELGYVVGETSMYSALPLLSGIDLTAPYCVAFRFTMFWTPLPRKDNTSRFMCDKFDLPACSI